VLEENNNVIIPINLDVTIHMLHVKNIPVRLAIKSQLLEGASLEETFDFMVSCAADDESKDLIQDLTFAEFKYLTEEWMKICMLGVEND
jgi:hypothetical protein